MAEEQNLSTKGYETVGAISCHRCRVKLCFIPNLCQVLITEYLHQWRFGEVYSISTAWRSCIDGAQFLIALKNKNHEILCHCRLWRTDSLLGQKRICVSQSWYLAANIRPSPKRLPKLAKRTSMGDHAISIFYWLFVTNCSSFQGNERMIAPQFNSSKVHTSER